MYAWCGWNEKQDDVVRRVLKSLTTAHTAARDVVQKKSSSSDAFECGKSKPNYYFFFVSSFAKKLSFYKEEVIIT